MSEWVNSHFQVPGTRPFKTLILHARLRTSRTLPLFFIVLLFSPMTKALYTNRKIKAPTWQHKNATKNFDYTTIADRLRTVSWGNENHQTGVVKQVYGIPTIPITTKSCEIKRTNIASITICVRSHVCDAIDSRSLCVHFPSAFICF